MSYFSTLKKEDCCGCEACRQICPKRAIRMDEDYEGFLYPDIDLNLCINCGLCESVCPISNDLKIEVLQEQKVFSMHTNNSILRTKSSSGGAFTVLSKTFCDKDYVIFGAIYDEEFNVLHDYIDSIDNIYKFRKSKYVQSRINNSYKQVLKSLKENKKVMFTGTPCQIAGLRQFLKKEYSNLLCVEIICHGVPSNKVWRKYIDYVEEKYDSSIKNINFRHKTDYNGVYNSKNIKIELMNGKQILEDEIKNLYLRGFHNNLFYRKSCTVCKFANPLRYADITIADCWGIEKINPNIDVHQGESMVVVNTKKGLNLWNNIQEQVEILELDLNFAIQSNEQFRKPTSVHINRDAFYKSLDKTAFNKNINRNIPKTYKNKIIGLMPIKMKTKLKKIKKDLKI